MAPETTETEQEAKKTKYDINEKQQGKDEEQEKKSN